MVFLRNMKRCPRTCIFGKRGLWARREVELLWPWESCACFFCQTFQIPGWEQDWTNPRRLHWLGGLPSLCSHLQDMTPDSGTCRQNTIVPHKYVQGWVIYNWGTKKKKKNYNRDKDILLKKKKTTQYTCKTYCIFRYKSVAYCSMNFIWTDEERSGKDDLNEII